MSINSSRTERTNITAFRAVDRTRELELWDAWVFAAGDATRALRAWEQADADDTAAAYVAYVAALDREEHAAAVVADRAAERVRLRERVLVAA